MPVVIAIAVAFSPVGLSAQKKKDKVEVTTEGIDSKLL